MSLVEVLTLVIAGLALLVSVVNALYAWNKDRSRIDISLVTLGRSTLELSIVNAGHRPLYVMDIAFTREDGAYRYPLFVDWVLIEEHVVERGRARLLQPWEPLRLAVPAETVRSALDSGYTWISVYDTRRRAHRERISDSIRRTLDSPPEASGLAAASD